jgi:inner membrane transporter RhtA
MADVTGIPNEVVAQDEPGTFGAAILALVGRRALRWPERGHQLDFVALTVSLAAMNLSFYGAISHAPLGVVVTVEFLGPLTVAVVGSRRLLDFVWVMLAAVGVVLLAGPTSSVSALGLGLALVAATCWGSSWCSPSGP